MTTEQIEKLALEVLHKMTNEWFPDGEPTYETIHAMKPECGDAYVIDFASRFLAAYLKECGEPVGWYNTRTGGFQFSAKGMPSEACNRAIPLFTHPVTIPAGMVLVSEQDQQNAERYKWLRKNNYLPKYPNSEFDCGMHLSFTVSGVWSDNMNPAVLDSCIDAARKSDSGKEVK